MKRLVAAGITLVGLLPMMTVGIAHPAEAQAAAQQQTFTVEPTSGVPPVTVRLADPDGSPCRRSLLDVFTSSGRVTFALLHTTGGTVLSGETTTEDEGMEALGAPDSNGIPAGAWAATFIIPPGTAPGLYTISARCEVTYSNPFASDSQRIVVEERSLSYTTQTFRVLSSPVRPQQQPPTGGGLDTPPPAGGITDVGVPLPGPTVSVGQVPVDAGGVSATEAGAGGLPITGFGAVTLAALGTWVVALGGTVVALSRRRQHRV